MRAIGISWAAIFGLITFTLAAPRAGAVVILDQSYIMSPGGSISAQFAHSTPGSEIAQTLIVGQTGYLAQVNILVLRQSGTTSDVQLDVRDLAADGEPGPDTLLTATLPALSVPSHALPIPFITFDLSANEIPVTQGEGLALVLSADAGNAVYAGLGDIAPYLGHEPYPNGAFSNHFVGQNWNKFSPSADISFQTFVNTPEPSALALVVMPLVTVLLRRSRWTFFEAAGPRRSDGRI